MNDFNEINLPEPKDYFPELKTDKEKRKEWNKKVFEPTNHKLVTSASHNFWKIMGVLFFILLIFNTGFFVYLVNNHKLDGLIQSDFNAQINNTINNEYKFNPTTENQYEHNIYNNHTIINNILCPSS